MKFSIIGSKRTFCNREVFIFGQCLNKQLHCIIVWFHRLSIPPPRKEFFLTPPHLSGNSSQASYIYLNFGPLRTPHPPQEFPIPSVGRVWIFSGTTHYNSMPTQ